MTLQRVGSAHTLRLEAVGALALVLAACAPIQTPVPSPTAGASESPSSAAASPTAEASIAGAPGAIVVLACGPAPSVASVCLGGDTGTVKNVAIHGSTMTLMLTVNNPGATASTPISMLLYDLDAGALPFGQPDCRTCNSTTSKSVIGLEWPALAPGETRTVDVGLPVTAQAGPTAWFASLYAQSLADVMTAEISGGIQPGQEDWKIATTIASK